MWSWKNFYLFITDLISYPDNHNIFENTVDVLDVINPVSIAVNKIAEVYYSGPDFEEVELENIGNNVDFDHQCDLSCKKMTSYSQQ